MIIEDEKMKREGERKKMNQRGGVNSRRMSIKKNYSNSNNPNIREKNSSHYNVNNNKINIKYNN